MSSEMKKISTDKAAAPAAPYSQAILTPPSSPLLFVSGQIPADPSGALVTGDIATLTAACCANIAAILAAAGSDLSKVVKVSPQSLPFPIPSPVSNSNIHPAGGCPPCGPPADASGEEQTTVFLSDMEYFAEMNKEYEKHFVHKPARSCVAVRELPKGVKVEIECVALG